MGWAVPGARGSSSLGRQEQGGSEGELCIFLQGSLLWSFSLKAEFQLHDQ